MHSLSRLILSSITGHGPFSHLLDQVLKRVLKESNQKKELPNMYKVMVLYRHALYFIFTVQLLTQHEFRSVEMLNALMKRKDLWKEFKLKEDSDGKFIKALITFGEECEPGKEEELLQV